MEARGDKQAGRQASRQARTCSHRTVGERLRLVGRGGTTYRELQQRTNEELDCSALYEQVQDLRSHAILNYLAVLKIAKKHDKHSDAPLRQKVRAPRLRPEPLAAVPRWVASSSRLVGAPRRWPAPCLLHGCCCRLVSM